MTTNFTGNVSNSKITINLTDSGSISYYSVKPKEFDDEAIFIFLKDRNVIGLSIGTVENMDNASNFLEIDVPENVIASDFFYFLTKELNQSGYETNVDYTMTISKESARIYQKYWDEILPILMAFGLQVVKPKKAKPRHKFNKDLSEIPFTIDYKGSKATVYWIKRSEFLIKKGATLVENAPLTKSGVIGFAGKFGLRLRQEQQSHIEGNILTSDITLRSVNEVGMFLYFAGTNSWLQLKSPEGKTLDELTIVK